MHLVVYYHHKPMLDTQHTQIRHYSRRVRETENKWKEKREEKKKKKRKPGRWKENERRGGLKRERIWAS